MTRPVRLRSLQTLVPEMALAQSRVRDLFAAQPGLGRLAQRIIATSFESSGIEPGTRFSPSSPAGSRMRASWTPRPGHCAIREPGCATRSTRGRQDCCSSRPHGAPSTATVRSTPSMSPTSSPSRAPASTRRDRTTRSCVHWAFGTMCAGSTSDSWDATRRCPLCGSRGTSASPTRMPWCWSSARSCARCTCGRRRIRNPSWRCRCSPTAPQRRS